MKNLEGKVALVTGAGRGIGRAIAVGLAKAGASLSVTDLDPQALALLAEEIAEHGAGIITTAADIADVGNIRSLFDATLARFGTLDILVNVAGMQTTTNLVDYTEENWDRQMAVNLRAVLFCSQEAAKVMIPKGSGKIVNISSTSAFVSSTNPKVAYDVSKAGVRHMTVSLGKELARHGINVNSVAPGTIMTDMTAPWLSTETGLAKSLSRIPLGRVGDVADVVGPVLFLCSSASDYIVGHTLVVDGGWLL